MAFVKTTLTLKYIIYAILTTLVTLFLVMSCEPQQEPSYMNQVTITYHDITYHQNHQNTGKKL